MKTFIFFLISIFLAATASQATTHTIVSPGFSYSPSNLTIELGDTVNFAITFSHNVVEVSQATWNVNGNAPLAGGFSRPFGGGIVVISSLGTHYYVCSPHASGGMKGRITVNPVTDVGPEADRTPAGFLLTQNYPNPFNPSTAIAFSIARTSFTEIAVYDGIGRRVTTLVSRDFSPGEYSVTWDGLDDDGSPVGSGPYYLRMTARNDLKDFFTIRKLLLVR